MKALILTTQTTLTSPRIAELQIRLAVGDSAAAETFWQELAEGHTPILEPIADDDKNMLVTFLWRGAEIKNVVLFSYLYWQGDTFGPKPLTRLAQTDIWFLTERVSVKARATYYFSPDDPLTPFDYEDQPRMANLRGDPLNPAVFLQPPENDPSSKEYSVSILELPSAPPQTWFTPYPYELKGRLEQHSIKSRILDNERAVWVYTPPGYIPDGEPYNLVVLFDGWSCVHTLSVPATVEKLVEAGRLSPTIVVMIGALDPTTRTRELPCYPPFVQFLSQELMPWVQATYNVSLDPARTVVSGISYGGLAAVYAGPSHPGLFGKILSQSGSFWWRPEDYGEHEWLTGQFLNWSGLSLEFYLEVGLFEQTETTDYGPTQLVATRHLRDVLRAKGYTVHYSEFVGGHEQLNWRGTLADGLLTLLNQ